MKVIGICEKCDLAYEDDGTKNNCNCPMCGESISSKYTFHNLATVVRFNYRGRIYVRVLGNLAKAVPIKTIIETENWYIPLSRVGNEGYECFAVDGTRLDATKPIPEELYNAQINISYGAGHGG